MMKVFLMMSQSFNDGEFQKYLEDTLHMSREDAASIAALRRRGERANAQGYHELAWQYNMKTCEMMNRSALAALTSGKFESDELFMYTDLPKSFPDGPPRKGVLLNLALIADSPLATVILELLKMDMEGKQHDI
jgi:hypothetical protein